MVLQPHAWTNDILCLLKFEIKSVDLQRIIFMPTSFGWVFSWSWNILLDLPLGVFLSILHRFGAVLDYRKRHGASLFTKFSEQFFVE